MISFLRQNYFLLLENLEQFCSTFQIPVYSGKFRLIPEFFELNFETWIPVKRNRNSGSGRIIRFRSYPTMVKVMTIIKPKLTRKSLDIQMTKMRSFVKVMTILISRLTRKHVFNLIHLLYTAFNWSSQCKAVVMVIQIPVSTVSLSWSWPAMSP